MSPNTDEQCEQAPLCESLTQFQCQRPTVLSDPFAALLVLADIVERAVRSEIDTSRTEYRTLRRQRRQNAERVSAILAGLVVEAMTHAGAAGLSPTESTPITSLAQAVAALASRDHPVAPLDNTADDAAVVASESLDAHITAVLTPARIQVVALGTNVRGRLAASSNATTMSSDAIDANALKVLRFLGSRSKEKHMIADISTATDVGPKTVGKWLKWLCDRGLAHRESERSGTAITDNGKRYVTLIGT